MLNPEHHHCLLWLFVLLSCLYEGETLTLHDGTYVLCASSPEQTALHTVGGIAGGVNTLHQREREPCNRISYEGLRFRTYDGTCNARNNLGAAFGPVKRLDKAYYQGKHGEPREYAKSGRKLPSVRAVSLAAHRAKPTRSSFTLMLMQFGQLLDHEITVVPVATDFDDTIHCCNVPTHLQSHLCFPIMNPYYDHAFGNCSEFVRSEPLTFINGTVATPRQHINAITAWVDASSVYGSDREKARELRTNNGTGALLKTTFYTGKERLPRGHDEDCVNKASTHYCALAGDDRVNEQPGLASIHLVFHLEHNRLVRKLVQALLFRQGRIYSSNYNVDHYLETAPLKIHERIYQIVRKVVGAVWQKIVYDEYLPLILGSRLMTQYNLWSGWHVRHDNRVDPSVSMEFLTAAFRYGHTLINDEMMTDRFHLLRDVFSTSFHYLDNYENVVKGLVSDGNHAEPFDPHLANSLTDHLFANTQEKMMGLDLAALNLQRGRDHGIPTYNEMRKRLHLTPKRTWREFGECEKALESVYEHVDDVELFTGGSCEPSEWNGVVGEVFGHILGMQFRDLKFGDKYFYESESSFYGFKKNELRAIDRMKFSKMVCENAQMTHIQSNPFTHPQRGLNPTYKCSDFVDLDMWLFTYYVE